MFLTRQLGILVFVCMAPLVLASLARGGDMTAVKQWAMRLLGLMFAPFASCWSAPSWSSPEAPRRGLRPPGRRGRTHAADDLPRSALLRTKVARGARTLVERNTTNPVARRWYGPGT
ncbi:hypothetical protein H4K36_01465 [Streptomyces sp. DHE7-1]|nr:hypothetical protein [Streptomyces sp. DHE7-1]